MVDYSIIQEFSTEIGFDLCGVTGVAERVKNDIALDKWIARGECAELEYMTRNREVRRSPTLLLDGAQSIIVCAMNYKSEYSCAEDHSKEGRIASYALMRDYHKTMRKRLKKLLKALQGEYPTLNGRCFVDSAPLFEKQMAVDAGLGWIGRQSLLITPEYGSFVVLGEIVIDQSVSRYDSPKEGVGCAECRRCVEACPTSAISQERMIDARRCISHCTIEAEGAITIPLNGWVFGCDECQRSCPYNRLTPLQKDPEFMPITQPVSRREWEEITEEQFAERFGATPLKRAGVERIKRAAKR